MRPTVAVVGALTVDHLVRAGEGARFNLLGGPGLYAALGARLVHGVSTALLTRVPADEPRFAELLDECRIDRSRCRVGGTVTRLWMLDSPQGRRIVPTAPEGGIELAENLDDIRDGNEGAEGFHSALLDGEAVLLCAPTSIRGVPEGALVGVDPEQRLALRDGGRYWRAIARPGVILFPSRVQLSALSRHDERAAARALAAHTGVPVVARLDKEGAFAVYPDGRAWSVLDSEATVVDSTGAGDAMAGATVAALAARHPLRVAAGIGVSVARLALSGWGVEGLLDRAAVGAPLPGIAATEASADAA
jgi:sugar/nucleoside kinase (ribokinase family)